MDKTFFGELNCPFCKSKLFLDKPLYLTSNKIINALVVCRCNKWPILDGILFISQDKTKDYALYFLLTNIEFLKKNRNLPLFFLRHPSPLILVLISLFSRIRVFKLLSFNQFVSFFKNLGFYQKKWADYLLEREGSKDFLAAKISASLVKKNRNVLDIGSGAGHLLKELNKQTPESILCGIDSSIPGLYLTKTYMMRSANLIYGNLEKNLPFRPASFDYILVNDSFHYVQRKKLLALELERIFRKKGAIIFNNLHNRFQKNKFHERFHFPETPNRYASFFSIFQASFFSEKYLSQGLLRFVKVKNLRGETKFTLIIAKNPPKDDVFPSPPNATKHGRISP